MKRRKPRREWVSMFGLALIAAVTAHPVVASLFFQFSGMPPREPFAFGRLVALGLNHVAISLLAVIPAAIVAIAFAVLVTRSGGRSLRPLADGFVAGSQAVPPVVVVALAFPALGFGAAPTVLALVIYCIMPILRGSVAALDAAKGDVAQAAKAMGMTAGQILREVEFPLALPVIADGFRVAVTLAVATAAVGALAGAATLGTPIILGLQNQNEVMILQGAAATGALAFFVDGLLMLALSSLRKRTQDASIVRHDAE